MTEFALEDSGTRMRNSVDRGPFQAFKLTWLMFCAGSFNKELCRRVQLAPWACRLVLSSSAAFLKTPFGQQELSKVQRLIKTRMSASKERVSHGGSLTHEEDYQCPSRQFSSAVCPLFLGLFAKGGVSYMPVRKR